MGIFKRKKKNHFVPGSTVTLYGTSNEDFQSSQLIDLSDRTVPGYPTITTYYGQPVTSLASGTYDELYTWMPPSGTYIDWYNPETVTRKNAHFDREFVCSYCGTKFIMDWKKVKDPMFVLNCPSCGGRI